MRSLSTAEFSKLKTCPSAQTLLSYNEASLAEAAQTRVAAHLACCDFCGAEMQLLLAHYQPSAAWAAMEVVPMPSALRRLAEDLLGQTVSALVHVVESVVVERERLTLTDA